MPRWNENDFVKHAQTLAKQHVVTSRSLNELSKKFAAEHKLNPEEIRTLVRLANVATFQEMFKQKADGDKMVEFETGDPEVVIRGLVEAAKNPPQAASVQNDKLASYAEIPNILRTKRQPVEEETKLASESTESVAPPVRMDRVVMNLEKLAEEFRIERLSAGARWEEKLAQVVSAFKKAPGYGLRFTDFEKTAWASFGDSIRAEMAYLYDALSVNKLQPRREKIAELQDRLVVEDSPTLNLLKEAHTARKTYEAVTDALGWLQKNTPTLRQSARG